MSETRTLVIGLGNPGSRYAGTRHNVGFGVLDVLAGRLGGTFRVHKHRAEVLEGRLASAPVVLAKPRSFMNESGGPVVAVSRFFKIAPADLVVVHDDLDLPYGALRLKRGGGDGGHNGLRSLTAALGTPDYTRVRLGIGRPPGRQDPADFVLREFSVTERKDLAVNLERAADAVEVLIERGLEEAQNLYNG